MSTQSPTISRTERVSEERGGGAIKEEDHSQMGEMGLKGKKKKNKKMGHTPAPATGRGTLFTKKTIKERRARRSEKDTKKERTKKKKKYDVRKGAVR